MLLEIIAGLLVLGALLVPWIVCVQKGKTGLVVVGLVLSVFGVGFVAMWIGAVRLAKPGSAWARRRYSEEKLARARARFPIDEAIAEADASEVKIAWSGEEVHLRELDRITRRALRKAGRL